MFQKKKKLMNRINNKRQQNNIVFAVFIYIMLYAIY